MKPSHPSSTILPTKAPEGLTTSSGSPPLDGVRLIPDGLWSERIPGNPERCVRMTPLRLSSPSPPTASRSSPPRGRSPDKNPWRQSPEAPRAPLPPPGQPFLFDSYGFRIKARLDQTEEGIDDGHRHRGASLGSPGHDPGHGILPGQDHLGLPQPDTGKTATPA